MPEPLKAVLKLSLALIVGCLAVAAILFVWAG
jgi:hypothetical protein